MRVDEDELAALAGLLERLPLPAPAESIVPLAELKRLGWPSPVTGAGLSGSWRRW